VGSLVFLVVAPGVIAGLVPWLLTGWEAHDIWGGLRLLGLVLIGAGIACLLHAFARFVVEGLGTPAPIAPTERLVVGGLYRYVRNPMYLAVGAVIVGQALLLGRPVLIAYAALFGAAVAAFVRWYEEPTLARQFGAEYEVYRGAVPGWWPRLTPWDGQIPTARIWETRASDPEEDTIGTFSGYQNEIYVGGLQEARPDLPTDLTRLEGLAEQRMPAPAFGYVAGAAGSEATARANRAAFDAWRIVPRMLRDVSLTDLSVTVLGTPLPAPVLLAPVGVLSIVHPDGETAVARAAASFGLPMVVSTAASTTMEDVAAAGGDAPRWYQLYWPKDGDLAVSFLERASAAGYRALVVTVDTYTMGWRPRDLDNAFLPFLQAVGNQNYLADPVFQRSIGGPIGDENRAAAILQWGSTFGNPALTWNDLGFLREHWDGPIAVKGILHPDDARRAVEAGMDGVIVSNHGGRQVDGAIASLHALPAIVAAVGDELAVLFDGGVRTGADVVKALALGAQAVLLGRPYVYGLGLGGEAGVRHVLRCILAELELTMALSGVTRPAELTQELLTSA
jgi:lactate 2-monooxygenase